MKFKHGQKVKCTIEGTKIEDAKISINEDGIPFICQNEKRYSNGAENKLGYKYSWRLYSDFTCLHVKNLRPAEKDWDSLEVGDIMVSGKYEREVLGICGRVIFLSYFDDKDKTGVHFTKKELIEYGYKIKQETPETITIAGRTYDKQEVESRLSGLEEIK